MRPSNFHIEANKKWASMIEQVNKGKGWKDIKSCPVCNCEDSIPEFTKFHIDLVRCPECQLRYHVKAPVDINDAYNSPTYMQGSQGFWTDDYEYRKERFGRERMEILTNTIGDIKGKSILDVGCGSGYFLDCAKEKGAICYGLEIADDIRQWVSRQLGIKVFSRPIEELASDTKFDVITMFDLIEHVERPAELLLHAHRLLKNGGHVFFYTPNFDSFGIKVMQDQSNLISPAAHLLFFTSESLQYVLNKVGFQVVYSATRGLDIADIISMFESNRDTDISFIETWKEHLQAMIDYAGCGNSLRMIATKPTSN